MTVAVMINHEKQAQTAPLASTTCGPFQGRRSRKPFEPDIMREAAFACHIGPKPSCGRLLPRSVQLAFARQDAKEQGESDDERCRSDDSYSPRRHWRFKSPTRSVGPGLRTDV